jgi:hypothetical protein
LSDCRGAMTYCLRSIVGTSLNVWRIGFSVAVQFIYEPWVKRSGVQWVWGAASFISLFGFACIALLMWQRQWLRKFDLWPSDLDTKGNRGGAVDADYKV